VINKALEGRNSSRKHQKTRNKNQKEKAKRNKQESLFIFYKSDDALSGLLSKPTFFASQPLQAGLVMAPHWGSKTCDHTATKIWVTDSSVAESTYRLTVL
jgi:hypothetical protein